MPMGLQSSSVMNKAGKTTLLNDQGAHFLKGELRNRMHTLLRAIPWAKKVDDGNVIATHIGSWLMQSNIDHVSVAFFKGLSDEIDTLSLDNILLTLGIRRYIPFLTSQNDLGFIMLEAHIPLERISFYELRGNEAENYWLFFDNVLDIIFIPGLAFDKFGHRLGRGKGYYDRALARIKSAGTSPPLFIGLAMDEQIVPNIPVEEHDVLMDYLCTPSLGVFPISRP
jgi:5,10-methenyltetrahydrofolate synthetase